MREPSALTELKITPHHLAAERVAGSGEMDLAALEWLIDLYVELGSHLNAFDEARGWMLPMDVASYGDRVKGLEKRSQEIHSIRLPKDVCAAILNDLHRTADFARQLAVAAGLAEGKKPSGADLIGEFSDERIQRWVNALRQARDSLIDLEGQLTGHVPPIDPLDL